MNLELYLPQYNELITLDIIEQMNHDVILGMPWLRKYNPDIYWDSNIINFQCNYTGYRSKEVFIIKLWAELRRTGQRIRILWYQVNIYLKKKLVRLLNKYTQFEDLVKNDLKSITLSEYKLWDYKIPLLEGKSPIYGPIYAFNQWEMEELKKYINKN